MKHRHSYTAAFKSGFASAESILKSVHAEASNQYRCGDIRDWRGTGGTFVLWDGEGRGVEFICTPLLNSSIGDLLLNVAAKRTWRSFFGAGKFEHVRPVVLESAAWLKTAGIKKLLWARDIVPNFESIESWDDEPPKE